MTMRGIDLVARFRRHGQRREGERLSLLEHALQCAALARRARSDDEVVIAALLHDVGRLLGEGTMPTDDTWGRHHGTAGAALVRPFVSARIAWLIEHHVVAKRYLCTVDARYAADLSARSPATPAVAVPRLSLDEQVALETHPWFANAVALRRWDDGARVPGAPSPPLEDYRPLLERLFGPQTWSGAAGIGALGLSRRRRPLHPSLSAPRVAPS